MVQTGRKKWCYKSVYDTNFTTLLNMKKRAKYINDIVNLGKLFSPNIKKIRYHWMVNHSNRKRCRMDSQKDPEKVIDAVRVARMFYHKNMKMDVIARDMNISRSSVSRLLTYAKSEGLIDIRIVDPNENSQKLEKIIGERYHIRKVHVVPVSNLSEEEWLEHVALYTANYLNMVFGSGMILGIAWGTTTSAISRHLTPKATYNTHVIQLNGAGNTQTLGIEYASEIIQRFAHNYQAQAHLFPVPTFFDYPRTKQVLWKERSIRQLLDLQQNCDLLVYSIGAVKYTVKSHIYSGGYFEKKDCTELRKCGVAGEIAAVYFKEDGSFNEIPFNDRSSGPGLELFQKKYGICVISGLAKVRGLRGALRGKLMSELIIDEPTALSLIESEANLPDQL